MFPIQDSLVSQAERLIPKLYESLQYPQDIVEVESDQKAYQGWAVRKAASAAALPDMSFGKDESVILDFGDHQVGYITLHVKHVGSPPDAPLGLKLIFGEMPCEVAEPFDSYEGWLSKSWLQEETVYIDVLPAVIRLPRRYSFRYVKLWVLDTSRKFKVAFTEVQLSAVTSADVTVPSALPDSLPDDLKALDRIGMKTLQDCMQTVFEDGPKRDRRLWIGDLRLQALANYYTFRNDDLVKRCLYLFGGMLLEKGEVGACVYERPYPHVDDIYLYDYSLFFVATLYDYYQASNDRETLLDLWPVAREQVRIALERVDEQGLVRDDPSWWCFIDWHADLNKQASAQAVLAYCLRRALVLARDLAQDQLALSYEETIEALSSAAKSQLWDQERGLFVSGTDKQVSWASQIWMVLAGIPAKEQGEEILERLFVEPDAVPLTTPYAYHHLIEALVEVGNTKKAVEQLRYYWGGMYREGADCFWELYNPEDKTFSPYGSNLINSYCHAWSCTPSYFIRKYFV
jgi:alpha-L-rhamnosidase